MTDGLLVVAGVFLVGLAFVDALATTLAVSSGAGPLTTAILGGAWRVALRLHRRDRRQSLLRFSGPVMLIATVLTWVTTLWLGWTLLFAGSGSVVTAQGGRAAGPADVVYFTGLTLFTLGTGDFVASSPGWRVAMAVAAFSGLFLITLAITYLFSVLQAVVGRRVLAQEIHGLGAGPSRMLRNAWDGEGFGMMFQQRLVALSSSLARSAEQHLAYPVLHYFHAGTREMSASVAVGHLDEALTVITSLDPRLRPPPAVVDPLRSSVGRYLATTSSTTWAPAVGTPPPIQVHELVQEGIPIDEGALARAVEEHRERRTQLHRLVASDGWSCQSDG